MAVPELQAVNNDVPAAEARLRDALQVIGAVLYAINTELSPNEIRIRSLVHLGEAAFGCVADILDVCAPRSVPNAKIAVMNAGVRSMRGTGAGAEFWDADKPPVKAAATAGSAGAITRT